MAGRAAIPHPLSPSQAGRMIPGCAALATQAPRKFQSTVVSRGDWIEGKKARPPRRGWYFHWRRFCGLEAPRVLIVGADKRGQRIAAQLQDLCVVLGFLDQGAPSPLQTKVLGRIEDLISIARATFADEVIVAIPQQRDWAQWTIREASRHHLDVKLAPDLLGFEADAAGVDPASAIITLHREPFPASGLLWKRVTDVVVSTLLLATCLPILLLIALAIRLDSPGPVLYCAPRMGRKGQAFRCYKFRTMVREADRFKERLRQSNQRQGAFFKIVRDPRVTRIGRVLRRYSLDELPQLWNVLRGDMSLVGPRPHPLDDFQRYHLEDLRRLDVLPGLTGLWQVTARCDPSFERNMELDLEYIEHWSWWYDMRILGRTLFVVFEGSGA
ncbi:MAG: exopolysaccharide biosynthesis polyprenyl glycosylphosphotransferase [Acidobacteria bacterium]|nr:exopolysaccharide biosynthesis polyprenyl glycosylphosphotransferase [Acidobacteriota bacterium]